VYNAGKYLRPSVLSIINQTYSNLDILIIDDGSTDNCLDTIQHLRGDSRIRIIQQANLTKPVALNKALEQARGEFYAIHDADDISYPLRIEHQLQALLNDQRLAAVFCGSELIINGKPLAPVFAPKSELECKRDIEQYRIPATDPTVMYRMSLVRHLRYDVSLPVVEGMDYIFRVGEQHPMIVLGECLYGYRILSNSLTRQDPARRDQLVAEALRQARSRRQVDDARIFPDRTNSCRRSQHSVADNNIAAHFMKSVLDQRRARRRWGAFLTGVACARLQPLDPHYYKALAYAASPEGIVKLIRSQSS
jgi:glycosyltransferase involved in cell wall biosynthesis